MTIANVARDLLDLTCYAGASEMIETKVAGFRPLNFALDELGGPSTFLRLSQRAA